MLYKLIHTYVYTLYKDYWLLLTISQILKVCAIRYGVPPWFLGWIWSKSNNIVILAHMYVSRMFIDIKIQYILTAFNIRMYNIRMAKRNRWNLIDYPSGFFFWYLFNGYSKIIFIQKKIWNFLFINYYKKKIVTIKIIIKKINFI